MRPLFQQPEQSKKFRTPSRTEQRRRRLGFEACESRLMMSADPVSLSPAEHAFAAPAMPHLGEFLASSAAFQGSTTQFAPAPIQPINLGGVDQYHGPVDPPVDLSVTESDSAGGSSAANTTGNVTAGQTLTYTVQVSNMGTATADAVWIDDPMPNGLTGGSWTATSVGGATGFSTHGTGDIDEPDVTLPPDSWITYTITGTVSSAATGALSDWANAESSRYDPSNGNVGFASAVDNDNVSTDGNAGEPDLTIVNSDNAGGSSISNTTGSFTPGQTLTYTVVVSNTGTAAADGTEIADMLPSGFTGDTWTATGVGGATGFDVDGVGNIDQTGVDLPPGSSVVYVISGTAISTNPFLSTLSNTATVTAAGGTFISATDNDNYSLVLGGGIVYSFSNSDNAGGSSATSTPGTVTPGQSLTDTVEFTNAGDETFSFSIDDVFPTAFGHGEPSWTADHANSDGLSYITSGTGDIHDTLTLAPDSSVTYTITGTVSSAAPDGSTFSNTATVTLSAGNTISETDSDTVVVPELRAGSGIWTVPHRWELGGDPLTNSPAPPVDIAISTVDSGILQSFDQGTSALGSNAALPAASGSTALNAAAVDAALAGAGQHRFSSLLESTLVGGTGDSRSTRTPSTSSFAALADSALVDFEPSFHPFV
jgi:uncharacterized repeat protein (TIGR01451 family)